MNPLDLLLAIGGGALLVLGASSGLLRNRFPISQPLLATLVGILVGPAVFDLLAVDAFGTWHRILEEAARLTVAIALVDVAMTLPKRYLNENWRPVAVMIGLVMPLMALASALLVWWLLGVDWWVALLIGAVVTPTDPVLASGIVTGKTAQQNVPGRVRYLILAEAGANDALALPLVLLPLIMMHHADGPVLHWLTHAILWEVGIAVIVGLVVGEIAGRVLRVANRHTAAKDPALVTVGLALALTLLGLVHLVGSDGLLAAFVATLAMKRNVDDRLQEEQEELGSSLRRFFEIPVFILFGIAIPWQAWGERGWVLLALVALILLLRRLPAVAALFWAVQPLRSVADLLFVGWFGPIGIAALFYAMLAISREGEHVGWEIGSAAIFGSILIHGITATPFTKWYGRVTGGANR